MTDGPIARAMREKLIAAFDPVELEIDDGIDGRPGGETHLNIRIVSAAFSGLSRLQRQRAVYACLAEALAGPVHALSVRAEAPGE